MDNIIREAERAARSGGPAEKKALIHLLERRGMDRSAAEREVVGIGSCDILVGFSSRGYAHIVRDRTVRAARQKGQPPRRIIRVGGLSLCKRHAFPKKQIEFLTGRELRLGAIQHPFGKEAIAKRNLSFDGTCQKCWKAAGRYRPKFPWIQALQRQLAGPPFTCRIGKCCTTQKMFCGDTSFVRCRGCEREFDIYKEDDNYEQDLVEPSSRRAMKIARSGNINSRLF